MTKRKLIIAITGASGIIYGIRLLEILADIKDIETHLIVSKSAERTRDIEYPITAKALKSKANVYYNYADIAASIASGSFRTEGMIIAPCSMKTLAEIATGVTANLISRAADVILKERRKLVLMVRETPFHAGHLKNMLAVTEMGGIIAPPIPAFYPHPQTIEDLVNQSIGRVLDLFDVDVGMVKRWDSKDLI